MIFPPPDPMRSGRGAGKRRSTSAGQQIELFEDGERGPQVALARLRAIAGDAAAGPAEVWQAIGACLEAGASPAEINRITGHWPRV